MISGFSAEDMVAEVIGNIGNTSNLTLKNAPIISQTDPNILIVFATTKDSHSVWFLFFIL